MGKLIQNFDALAATAERKIILDLIESGLEALQPENVLAKNISLQNNILTIEKKQYDLTTIDRVFLIGFGKGAAKNSALIGQVLGDKLTDGWVIDTIDQTFAKIKFTKGTHPLTSQENVAFTKGVVETMQQAKLTIKDLVIVVICGGGSAMFEVPKTISFEQKHDVDQALLHCGANITEMNIIRKHLSAVKGGGLAGILYPAMIATLVYSDVPGNDLSTIASGPTVKDPSTLTDVQAVLKKYPQLAAVQLPENAFHETPKDDQIFHNVTPFVVLSNLTILETMQQKAKEYGYSARILSDKYQSEANDAAKTLIEQTKAGEILLVGGETTVTVKGKGGEGGRNQQLALAALAYVGDDVTIASVGTDGWDNSHNAGAIGDKSVSEKATKLGLNPQTYLDGNDSLTFLEKTGDAIVTDKLPSNVADVILVLRKNTTVQPVEQKSESPTSVKPLNPPLETGTLPARYIIPELHDSKLYELEQKATYIRERIIEMLLEAGSGHSAGPLGMTDIFTCFYFHILNIDPKNPTDPNRDRLVLSNGHICPVQYATMAVAGFFPETELKTLRKINSRLQGHPHRGTLPGIENTSGPLGEGLSQAIGMALAARLDKKKYQVYCLMGDGEQNEGNVWESVMTAAKFKLHNLTVVIDRNNIQIDGFTEDVMPLESLKAKYEAFGWEVLEVDGHNYRAFIDAVREANTIYEKPTCIIAHTIPGRGVAFMEEDFTWHGKPPNSDEAKRALDELRTLQGKIISEHQ